MSFFKKLTRSAKSVAKQNVLEAIVAASVLVAGASGGISKDEVEDLTNLLDANDDLSSFSKVEKQQLVNKYIKLVETNYLVGKTKLLREIADIAEDQQDAEDTFVMAIAIAQTDGEVDEDEAKVLCEIGKTLGLDLKDYGVETA